jgi:hypothetical protein
MKLVNTAYLVKQILTEMPEARDDDYLLWLKVIERVSETLNIPDYTKTIPFGLFLATAKYSKLPHFETVSRTRRKIQEKFPELRATAETQAARSELEESYRDFARNY